MINFYDFENRSDRFRPLGEWAFRLIKKIIEEEGIFVISDHLVYELNKYYSVEQINDLFSIVPINLIIKINQEKEDIREAHKLSKKFNIPFADALHLILAKEQDAIMITRDNHFFELSMLYDIKMPEDLL